LGKSHFRPPNDSELGEVMEAAMTLRILRNEPFEITKESLLTAATQAHEMGLEIEQSVGNAAFNALHNN
jgi:hypothetical protein